MKATIKMFLKFGSFKDIKDLYENGTIYLNTIQHFRKHKDADLRGDKYEGASRVKNSLPGTFKIPGNDRTFNYQKIHIKEAFSEVLGNIYSLYCISSHGIPNLLEFKMDERIMEFGTHCLMIKDNAYFYETIQKQLKKEGYLFRHGFVKYYDKEKENMKLTLFHKPLEFEYQKEFRFYVQNDKLEPIALNIGSLKSYAEMYETKDIVQLKLINGKQNSQ